MPVSRVAYAFGILCFGGVLSGSAVGILIVAALVAGVDFHFTWAVLPIVAMTLLTMSGLTLFVVSYAPSPEAGSIMSNLLGILMALVSPVYFSMEQAPTVMKAFGWVSPLRYAADGMMKSLSGRTDVLLEVVVLGIFAAVCMGIGLWKLRWREN